MVESTKKVLRVTVRFMDGDKAEDLVEELDVDAETASFLKTDPRLESLKIVSKSDDLAEKMG
jgi:hypothetical protein